MHKKIFYALALLALMGILGLFFYGPVAQWASYHDFAYKTIICGIPNFTDTVSNTTFLLAGIFVLFNLKNFSAEYKFFFLAMGVSLCCLFAGSVFYHLSPNDVRLVWDRLPIASFFSLLFLQILFEMKILNLNTKTFKLAVIYWLGSCSSVFVWFHTADLRMYAFAQFFPLASLLILTPYCFIIKKNRRAWVLLAIISGYALAKVFEKFDYQTLMLTNGFISGHTTKHTIAGLTILLYFYMYKNYLIDRK